MKTSDFYYDLPHELIAQTPLENRQKSKMMVLDRSKSEVEHKIFEDIVDYINPGDTLVLNDTRVIPARLFGHRVGKEEKIEILLLKQQENDRWQTLVKPGKKCKIGDVIEFSDKLSLEIVDILEDGQRIVDYPVPTRKELGKVKFSSDRRFMTDGYGRSYKCIEKYGM